MSKLLSRLLQDSQSGNHLWNAIRSYRLREEEELTENYKWDGHIHPSSLSFNMCMEEYFAKLDVHEPWPIDNIYKAKRGTAIHREFQEEIVCIPNLLWERPSGLSIKLLKKLNETWPEVPVKDEEAGISGSLDCVINLKSKPVVMDIKTTSSESKWKTFDKSFPTEQQKTQVAIYTHLINKNKYYSMPVEKYGFAFLLIPIAPGDKHSEKEVYIDFTPELDAKCADLLSHIAKHRSAKLSGEDAVCTYGNCPTHGTKTA